jgi:hypothetical protein
MTILFFDRLSFYFSCVCLVGFAAIGETLLTFESAEPS